MGYADGESGLPEGPRLWEVGEASDGQPRLQGTVVPAQDRQPSLLGRMEAAQDPGK